MKTNPRCIVCNTPLNDENWQPSRRKKHDYICKRCNYERVRAWRKSNPIRAKVISVKGHRKRGEQPFNKNRGCSLFLGVHVAERVLSHVFKDVKRMPMHNPGYDFICNKGKKIDVKSSCPRKDGTWQFAIDHNAIADYFLLLAFDNREDLNPLHAWLIPGDKLNHLITATIRPSTIHRWDAYKLDIEHVVTCCNIIKNSSNN